MKKLLAGIAVGVSMMLGATSTFAAGLSIIGGTAGQINSDFSLTAETGLSVGSDIIIFDADNDNGGLAIFGGPTNVTFELLGFSSETNRQNMAIETKGRGSRILTNWNTPVGTTHTEYNVGDGFAPFLFKTGRRTTCDEGLFCAINGGDVQGVKTMAFAKVNDWTYIALFGDGSLPVDYDDMAIRISVVPLPPALLMFGGALLGLGWISRRRKLKAA